MSLRRKRPPKRDIFKGTLEPMRDLTLKEWNHYSNMFPPGTFGVCECGEWPKHLKGGVTEDDPTTLHFSIDFDKNLIVVLTITGIEGNP